MELTLAIGSIVLLSLVINILIKQSYNFVFMAARQPGVWIVIMGVIAIAVWGLASKAGWSINTPAWASTVALLLNLPPSQKSAAERNAISAIVDDIYSDLGIPRGRLLYRIGLATFAIVSVGGYFFGYGIR